MSEYNILIPGGWAGGSIEPFMLGNDGDSLAATESCRKKKQLLLLLSPDFVR